MSLTEKFAPYMVELPVYLMISTILRRMSVA